MKPIMLIPAIALLFCLYGCAVTKVATVPLRIGGAVISVVPIVGKPVDKVIDTAADIVD